MPWVRKASKSATNFFFARKMSFLADSKPGRGRFHEANFHKNEVFGRLAVANQNFIDLKKS